MLINSKKKKGGVYIKSNITDKKFLILCFRINKGLNEEPQ